MSCQFGSNTGDVGVLEPVLNERETVEHYGFVPADIPAIEEVADDVRVAPVRGSVDDDRAARESPVFGALALDSLWGCHDATLA